MITAVDKQMYVKNIALQKHESSPDVKSGEKTNRTDAYIRGEAYSLSDVYARMLEEGMKTGTGNGNPTATGTPIQALNARVFNASIAFGALSAQSGTNNAVLQSEFRLLILSLFDDAVLALHGREEDTEKLEQLRDQARHLGETFIGRFFERINNITQKELHNTGMVRAELAFHEAMNFVYFEVGMAVLGGSVDAETAKANTAQHFGLDGEPITFPTEEEFHRQMIAELLRVARENAEIFREFMEAKMEEMERTRKLLLIAARIAAGDNVPPEDREFILANAPGLYMIANASRIEKEEPNDYESVLTGEEQESAPLQSKD